MRLINIKENTYCEIAIIKHCIDFLFKNGGIDITIGRHDIPDSDIFANVSEYETKLFKDSIWEAHKEYADLQIVLDGTEKIMVSNISKMELGNYHSDSDYQECTGNTEHIIEMNPSVGLLLLPEDVHMPGVCLYEKPLMVKKCVFKIPMHYFR